MDNAHVKGADALNRRLTAISPQKGKTGKAILKGWQIRTVRGAKEKVRRRSGHLGRTIHAGMVTDTRATVEADAPYAAAIEFGARPHIIVPKHAKILAWSSNRGDYRLSGSLRKGRSANVFARQVNHPGNRPYPFLMPASREAMEEVGTDAIIAAWNGAA